jgi:surfactin synthase thioesterase subunit
MTADTALWLQCVAPRPQAATRLVCFPHAGGSASFFRDWGARLPGVEVYAVCYPGRGERIEEPPPRDLRLLASDIAKAVRVLADRPIALFGHSMGAVVALETAHFLEAHGIHLSHLFASGSRDAEPLPEEDSPLQDDPDVVAERLVRLGGTDPDLAADPMFRELVLPYVISDGQMFRAFTMDAGTRLHCPVTTIVGDADEEADRRPWRALSRGEVREVEVPGNHFYLIADPPLRVLAAALRETTPGQQPWPSGR